MASRKWINALHVLGFFACCVIWFITRTYILFLIIQDIIKEFGYNGIKIKISNYKRSRAERR